MSLSLQLNNYAFQIALVAPMGQLTALHNVTLTLVVARDVRIWIKKTFAELLADGYVNKADEIIKVFSLLNF